VHATLLVSLAQAALRQIVPRVQMELVLLLTLSLFFSVIVSTFLTLILFLFFIVSIFSRFLLGSLPYCPLC
jgi:hypothetical protein